MKIGFSRSFQVAALLSLITSTGLAAADAHYVLNSEYNVRFQPSTTAKIAGPVKDFNWQPLKFSDVDKKKEWVKVTSETGKFGYVHRDALKRVELKPDFELRTQPSLSKSKSLGQTGKTKDIVFTGKEEVVTEGKKSITWMEAWTAGKRVWIAAKAMKSIERLVASSPAKAAPVTVAPPVAAKPTAPATPAAPKVLAQECANTPDQFTKNPRLVKAFGGNQPFTNWSAGLGITLEPSSSGGLWTLKIPDMVIAFMKTKPGEKKPEPVTQIPLKVCIDKNDKPFVNAFGKDYPFTDKSNTKIELQYGSNAVEFTRTGTVR